MIFKEMNPDDVRKALEGHTNVIEEEVRRHEAYFKDLECLYCQGDCHPVVSPEKLFEKNGILPRYLAECSLCGCQFEPYTKIEVRGPQRDPLGEEDPTSIVDPRFDPEGYADSEPG
jgi:hypothetical protein